jgi:3-phenylpropionate/cinnamic acid dioxygenase small subunit
MTERTISDLIEVEALRDLVLKTAVLLDGEDLGGWIELYAPESEYEIVTFGDEIARQMTWWKSTKDELKKILDDVPRQVRDQARRLHMVVPTTFEISGQRGIVHSNFTVVRTTQDGRTTLYIAGSYVDAVVKQGGRWLYSKHQVVLHTRMLDSFTHIPL